MSVQIVVFLEIDTHILEGHGSPVFRVNQEDGGSIFPCNVHIHFQEYTVSQPRIWQSEE
jgi:hypothetical protein